MLSIISEILQAILIIIMIISTQWDSYDEGSFLFPTSSLSDLAQIT